MRDRYRYGATWYSSGTQVFELDSTLHGLGSEQAESLLITAWGKMGISPYGPIRLRTNEKPKEEEKWSIEIEEL